MYINRQREQLRRAPAGRGPDAQDLQRRLPSN